MNIDNKVLDVLSNASMNGNALQLTGQLDRTLYVSVNKVLELAGGKWSRKEKAHIFESDAADVMDSIILTGKIANKKQELGYFPTPSTVVERLIELAEINNGDRILEPSAGSGNILKAIRLAFPLNYINAVEIDDRHTELKQWADAAVYMDFLTLPHRGGDESRFYDRIVMNPPFGRNAAPAHVQHARKFLKHGGRLVSVMPSSVTFRTDALNTAVRSDAESIEPLPDNAFAESGTNVNTVIVTMRA